MPSGLNKHTPINVYFASSSRAAEYCDRRVVCLSGYSHAYLRNHTSELCLIFCACCLGRGSVLLRLRCSELCTSGFVDNVMLERDGQE